MNKFLLAGILAVTSSALIGCSKDEDKKEAMASVPEQLGFVEPRVKGQKLTSDQMQRLRSKIGVKQTMELPESDLIFGAKRFTGSELRQKELELKSKDANSYLLLKDIQAKCVKRRPTVKVDASFPGDGDGSYENLRTGDHMSAKMDGALQGASCPVDFDFMYGADLKMNEIDQAKKKLTASGAVSTSGKAIMLDPKYQALLGMKGVLLSSGISGLAIQQDSKAKALVQFQLNGKYILLNEEIPFDGSVQMLLNSKSETDTVVEMKAHMKLKEGQSEIDIQIYQKALSGDKTPVVPKIFVNGHSMTESEFKNLFGEASPVKIEAEKVRKVLL